MVGFVLRLRVVCIGIGFRYDYFELGRVEIVCRLLRRRISFVFGTSRTYCVVAKSAFSSRIRSA